MIQRISVLARYFIRTVLFSLTGILYLLLTLAVWFLLFNPQQQTPDAAYYRLLIGGFGAGLAFLVTLSVAARANDAQHYPFLVRLNSRVEFVTAVLFSSLFIALIFQLLLMLLALVNGPSLTLGVLLEIPPIWLPPMLLMAVLALHASDFVTIGWSRIYVFGLLAILLFGRGLQNESLASLSTSLSRYAINQGWVEISNNLENYAHTLNQMDDNIISRLFGFVFWPFEALAEGIINGYFTANQSLAPAILLLYATVLFLLAVDLFANKDLEFTE
ncbi:hypothetical protein [Candidatus Leptofilum sp.]|uniref:hypothetical protein n=1 Tax=Candidatus Leptofilum sp. TaxID=3241576 RepID=UPI003B5930C0